MNLQEIFPILLPIFTLVLGYFLNLGQGYFESRQAEVRRRRADKEKSYAAVSAKLHELFETYRRLTLNSNLNRVSGFFIKQGDEEVEIPAKEPDFMALAEVMGQEYDELRQLVFEESLYLPSHMIEQLLGFPSLDLRRRWETMHSHSSIDEIRLAEEHVERLWSDAKGIMNEMRIELGLEPYPDDVMKLWR